jgi:hypothetical protein
VQDSNIVHHFFAFLFCATQLLYKARNLELQIWKFVIQQLCNNFVNSNWILIKFKFQIFVEKLEKI